MRRLSGLIYFDEYQEIENDGFKAFLFFAGTSMALGGIFVLTVRLHLSRLPSPTSHCDALTKFLCAIVTA